MFERTANGQSNRAVFLDVDFICYVEGGVGDEWSGPDAVFWGAMFDHFRPELSIRFVPKGGKPILEALARDIMLQGISNTLVAMDSDYDELFGHRILDRRILYTWGYSWENDLLIRENFIRVVKSHFRIRQLSARLLQIVEDHFAALGRSLARPTQADFVALQKGSSILPRNAPGRLLSFCSASGSVSFNTSEFRKLCRAVCMDRRHVSAKLGVKVGDVMKFCPGKFLAYGIFCVLKAVANALSVGMRISADLMVSIAFGCISDTLRTIQDGDFIGHYRKSLTSVS